jgi:hypothetical protein
MLCTHNARKCRPPNGRNLNANANGRNHHETSISVGYRCVAADHRYDACKRSGHDK